MSERRIAFAKTLRGNSTDAERLLWSHLRASRLEGLKFRRQHPIGNYIADFVYLENKLVIELDGGQHNEPEQKEYDRKRDAWLEKEGYRVLRFWDHDVLLNINDVLTVIHENCSDHPLPIPPPSRGRGEKKTSPM